MREFKVEKRASGSGWAIELRKYPDGYKVWDVEDNYERIDDVIMMSVDKPEADKTFNEVVGNRKTRQSEE